MRILNSTTGAYSITLVVPLCIQVLKALQYKLLFATGSKLVATSRNVDSFQDCGYKATVEVVPQAQLASAAARRAFGLSGYRCS